MLANNMWFSALIGVAYTDGFPLFKQDMFNLRQYSIEAVKVYGMLPHSMVGRVLLAIMLGNKQRFCCFRIVIVYVRVASIILDGFPLFKQDMFNLRQSTPLKPLKFMACCPTPWLAGYFLQ